LRIHSQGFFVGERLLLMCTGEEPLLCIEFQLTLNIRLSARANCVGATGRSGGQRDPAMQD
jgi:hypothetical protein